MRELKPLKPTEMSKWRRKTEKLQQVQTNQLSKYSATPTNVKQKPIQQATDGVHVAMYTVARPRGVTKASEESPCVLNAKWHAALV